MTNAIKDIYLQLNRQIKRHQQRTVSEELHLTLIIAPKSAKSQVGNRTITVKSY